MDLRTEKEEGKVTKAKATVSLKKKKKINAFEKSPERLEKEKKCEKTQITSFSNEGQTLQTLRLLKC